MRLTATSTSALTLAMLLSTIPHARVTAQTKAAAKAPLGIEDVVTLLGIEGFSTDARLTVVNRRCLTFKLDDAAELKFRRAGADDAMIVGLAKACRRDPAATPSAKPTADILRAEVTAALEQARVQREAVRNNVQQIDNAGVKIQSQLLDSRDGARAPSADQVKAAQAVGTAANYAKGIEAVLGAWERSKNEKKVFESLLEMRAARIASGEPDVGPLSQELRPKADSVAIPSLGARVINLEVAGYKFTPEKGMFAVFPEPTYVPGHAVRGSERAGVMWYPVQNNAYITIDFDVPKREQDSRVVFGCDWYHPGGTKIRSWQKEFKIHRKSQHFSINMPLFGKLMNSIESGVYAVQCSADGQPFVNATLDAVASGR